MGEKKLDPLGDRMKGYEGIEAKRKFLPTLPVIARIDGRSFSSFTSGLQRPYDERFSRLMVETTKFLVEETGAKVGYTQSDEISLLFYAEDYQSEIFFNGRIQKLVSVLAGLASACFNKTRDHFLPGFKDHATPVFDARVWQLPSCVEASNCFIWREQDAVKNSISMLAQSRYSHNQLMHISTKEMLRMLEQEHGVYWDTYPTFFKRGTYVQRKTVQVPLSDREKDLPMWHEARDKADFMVERHKIKELEMPVLTRVLNRVGVLFFAEEPIEASFQD